jgi:endonuclease/exonuclease/phosphatase (EEP) superfamily protein YafD
VLRRAGWTATVLLLLTGAVLTLARLWQPASGPFAEAAVRLAAVVPLAVPAYAAAAVGAALLARHHRWALTLLVAAVAGLGLHLAWFAPFLTDDAPAAVDGPRLRVLTVNAYVHDGVTGAGLVRLARSADADVVVVQELSPATYDEALRAGLDDVLPHRAGEEQGSATMIWSRFPLRDVRDLADRTGGGSVRASVEVDGAEVDLLGVHTAPPVWPRPWRADHAALLDQVRERRPDVLAGDLNVTPDHLQLRRLLDEGLRDAVDLTGSGWAPTWPSNGRVPVLGLAVPRFAAIDHVLVAAGWTVLATQRWPAPGSDHTAVLAEVAPAR